jgi:hypothetical protein
MKIKYSKRETRNLGNYENVTVEISVEDTMDLTETKEQCFDRLREFVTSRLPFQFNKTEDKIQELKTEEVDIEEVKNKVLNLIDHDNNNRQIIKSILGEFNAEKLQELNRSQLKEFNNKIMNLR